MFLTYVCEREQAGRWEAYCNVVCMCVVYVCVCVGHVSCMCIYFDTVMKPSLVCAMMLDNTASILFLSVMYAAI